MITNDKLDFWIQNNLNVLIIGTHGTGKSTMIIEAANRNKLKWKYFSAATMDPFCDFIGIPKEREENGQTFLEFVRPKEFVDNDYELLVFDEFNRGMKKTTNSVMELIQFKSVNGNKFKNLRMVWAAINPEDTGDESLEYAVEKLDPAIKDRFHIIVEADDTPNGRYFYNKYADSGKTAISWWKALDKKIQKLISPRRLDYALEIHNLNGDIGDVLPKEANIGQLIEQLNHGSYVQRLDNLLKNKDDDATKAALLNENFFKGTIEKIKKSDEYLDYFLPLFSSEKFNKLIVTDNRIRNYVLHNEDLKTKSINNLKMIITANTAGRKIIEELKNKIKNNLNDIDFLIENCLENTDHIDHINTTPQRQMTIDKIIRFNYNSTSAEQIKKLFTIVSIIAFRTYSEWADINKAFNTLNKIYTGKFLGKLDELFAYAENNDRFKYFVPHDKALDKMHNKWGKWKAKIK